MAGAETKVLNCLPVAVVAARGSTVAYSHFPKDMKNGKEILKHILVNLEKGNIPTLEIGNKQINFPVAKCPDGMAVVVAHETAKPEKHEKDLLDHIEQLDRFRRLAVGRELTIMELKRQVEMLKKSIEGAHG